MKKAGLLFLLWISIVWTSGAQAPVNVGVGAKAGKIAGKVIDSETGMPLEFANIIIYDVQDSSMVTGSMADATGTFVVENLPFGQFYAEAKFIGYDKNQVSNIKLSPGQKVVNVGVIKVAPAVSQLEEIEVTAERTQVDYRVDKKVINVSDNIAATGGNAVMALENIPSIQVDIEGNVLLRGSSNFTVFIDGKPTVLDPSEVLQQTPASSIENIEIITNPSAKYDPDGVAGIINIVLKKKREAGMNGVVNAMVGTNDKYQVDGLVNMNRGKWNFFLGLNYQDRKFLGEGTGERITDLGDTSLFLNTTSDGFFKREGESVRAGVGYQLNDNHKLSMNLNMGNYAFGRESNEDQITTTEPTSETTYIDNFSSFRRDGRYFNSDLTWNWDIGENQNLVTYFYYAGSTGENNDFQNSDFLDENGNPTGEAPFRTLGFETSTESEYRFKTDYTHTFANQAKLEAGYQWRKDIEQENFTFSTWDPETNDWPVDPDIRNTSNFERDIHGFYATYASKLSFLEYMIGLRGEYTDRSLENVSIDSVYSINRMDWFPTLHLSKPIGEQIEVYTSYSRRIDRPRSWYLDPFVYQRDQFTKRAGNPALEPEYIDSYEFGVQREFEKVFVGIEGYHRITRNKITRVQSTDPTDPNVIIYSWQNLSNDKATGAELSVNYFPSKKLSFNISGNVYNYQVFGDLGEQPVDQSSTNVDGRLNATWKAAKNTRLQLNTIWMGPTVTAQGERQGMYGFNVSVRQDMFKNKLSATLQARDIFDTMNFEYTSNGTNFTSTSFRDRESQIIMLTLSFKINNYRPDRRERGDGGGGMDMGGDF
ncbi:MAG TPA: hypothetical protein DDY13_04900 [Cytophagales bacterium]|jgi:outer membrane receptor protein involved in Fe transport|nr:hypothetical protein [Cytophagales bacterium]